MMIFEERFESARNGRAMSMLALSHTPAEQQLYEVMLTEVVAAKTRVCAFNTRQLMALTGLPNYSATRRGLNGLISKLSIEHHHVAGGDPPSQRSSIYLVFKPEEIFTRRTAAGFTTGSRGFQPHTGNLTLPQAVERVAERHDLSRREAQVTLYCAEGLTNNEISERLHISEQTVKYHLRHIFVKYGVKRRTELISNLLTQ